MTKGIKPLVAGNWKMNGTSASLPEARSIGNGFMRGLDAECDALLCVPSTLITRVQQILSSTPVKTGGQDCHPRPSGAHTGDISAEMLKDAGASHVIVGHSERRADHGETDAIVRAKAEAAWLAGLVAIICVGETRAERDAGKTLAVLTRQLSGSIPDGASAKNTIIAYEPVWAIGTGLTPSPDDVAAAHAHIRAQLGHIMGEAAASTRILYGGSVKPSNAVELLAIDNVDGALVGGASLKAADFLGIAEAYRSF
ncbi:MAG: triose-phosphate isomerase [Mesorhizobium sp.]